MTLNVKVFEIAAKIKSQQKPHVRLSCDALFADYIPTMKDYLRDLQGYLKKVREELKEENRNYRN